MRQGKGITRLKVGAGAIACGLAVTAFGASGSASAAEGDTFFLLNKKNTAVSFVVRADSSEASEILYHARRIPCRGKPQRPPTAMGYLLDGSSPIDEKGAFFLSWSPQSTEFGGINGTVEGDNASGTLDLKIGFRKPHGKNKPPYKCGIHRKWDAKSVSEQRWTTVRKKRFGDVSPFPPQP